MKANEVRFQELLNGKIQYRVPLFQRTYSWMEENWQRLWDDLLEIYELPEPRSHFIGAIVTQPIEDAPEFCAKYLVIDGQQRLATLFILLSTIRDAARAREDTQGLGDEIEDDCLINKHAKAVEEREKMRPTQRDAADLKAVFAGEPLASSSLIAQAYKFFRDVLVKGDLGGNDVDLARLKSCVTDYLNLVSIMLDGHDSAPRIFESLNNTGMPLTASDLVRNHIFMSITSEEEQEAAYHSHWMPMQSRMEEENGRSALSDFFWRYLMMDGHLPRYDEVFEGMRDRIDEDLHRGKTLVQVLEQLNAYSALYVRIWQPSRFETLPAICDQLNRLNQWEVDVAYPFILTAMNRLQLGQLGEDDLLEVLQMIESYAVRRFICGVPTNRLRRIFAGMSGKVSEDGYVESCRRYLMDNDWPMDGNFHEMFQAARIYTPARLSRTRLILTSLEQSYEHHEQILMTDQITIEHVMPQTLNDEWRSQLGEVAGEIHEKYLHTVGNVTYSGYNSEMGNLPFERKKNILQQSRFELNQRIVQASAWTANEIQARARELADRALAIWKRAG